MNRPRGKCDRPREPGGDGPPSRPARRARVWGRALHVQGLTAALRPRAFGGDFSEAEALLRRAMVLSPDRLTPLVDLAEYVLRRSRLQASVLLQATPTRPLPDSPDRPKTTSPAARSCTAGLRVQGRPRTAALAALRFFMARRRALRRRFSARRCLAALLAGPRVEAVLLDVLADALAHLPAETAGPSRRLILPNVDDDQGDSELAGRCWQRHVDATKTAAGNRRSVVSQR